MMRERSYARLAAVAAVVCAMAATAKAQKRPIRTFGVRAVACGGGVTLRMKTVAAQGDLLVAEVHAGKALRTVSGEWNGRELQFWQDKSHIGAWRALVGVDLEEAPGVYELRAAANGGAACTAKIKVRAGKFATESLKVEKQFVEPDAEQVKRATEERDHLRAIFASVTPDRLWDGKFRIPLDGATTGSNFGKRRISNGQAGSPHGGADFPAVTGTPVHAAQKGKVALAEGLFFSGNTVVLDHGLGVYTFYGHLSEIGVKVGDEVEAGAVLGKVGATGRATGAHLHWGLTVEKSRVNPVEIVGVTEDAMK